MQRIAQDFNLWREEAQQLYDAGLYADAAARGRELIQTHPDQVHLHYNVACCEARQGRAAESIAMLRSAVQACDGFRDMATESADFDPIRSDPAFQKLTGRWARRLRRLGIPARRGCWPRRCT